MCDKAAAMGPASKTTPIMLIKSQSADFHFGEKFSLCITRVWCYPSWFVNCLHPFLQTKQCVMYRDTCKCSVLKKSLPLEEEAGTFFAFRASNYCRCTYICPYMGVCRCVTAQCFVAHV